MTKPSRGDVWLTDMGIAGKVRPCLLLTDHPQDDELALITVLPHTTALRGNRWEVEIPKSFLKPGAFHLQQIQSLSLARLVRILGRLDDFEMDVISARLRERLAG
ncbi:MAG: type II toxin-antitoxin system PemK/MazF family toxin [Verrucomicrobiota bacterium]|jgi:mRNA interferase MazF